MRKSVKAALFSLLLFPGSGHFVARHWLRGLLFILPTLAACAFVVAYSVDRALVTVDQILAGDVAADTASIQAALDAPPSASTARLLTTAKYLILFCYIGAAVDAARLGHKLDKAPPPESTFLPKTR